ncbi:MAG TPA: LysR family transcriptional regulator [Gammaproteobacteria bacterium]|nr:LysR family transcriptional regulator [Gammaproteobacteria bacterium]
MDIELLRTFLAVVRTRHFGRTAEELCVTQSAVSARIRQLEKTLGIRLFSRMRNNIQLTPEGRQLQKHAQTILHAWARACQETGLRAEFTGGLAIGALWDLWETLLAGWSNRIRQSLPEVALQVEAGARDRLLRRLMDGSIDLAIVFEPPQSPDLEIREQGILNLVLAATQQGLGAAEAFERGYIMVDWGEGFARDHTRLFPDLPAPVLRMNHAALARRYLAQSEGSAYLAETMLAAGHGGRPLYPVSRAPVMERAVFAVYRSGSEHSERVRQALALL